MERFSGDYIRQQPEYRYLVYKDKDHIIQTSVEDGEIKLHLGPQPIPAKDYLVRLPNRPSRVGSVESRGSSTVSRCTVYHLTTAQGHNSTTSDTQPEENSNRQFHNERQTVNSTGFCTESQDRNVPKHRPSSADASDRLSERKRHSENKELGRINDNNKNVHSNGDAKQSTYQRKNYNGSISEDKTEASSDDKKTYEDLQRNNGGLDRQYPKTEANESDNNARTITEPSVDVGKAVIRTSVHIGQTTASSSSSRLKSEDGNTEDTNTLDDLRISVSVNQNTSNTEQFVNKGNESGDAKTEGTRVLSADTESKQVTGQRHYENFTDLTRMVIKNEKIVDAKNCGATERKTNSHTVSEETNNISTVVAQPTCTSRNQHVCGQTDGIKQKEALSLDICGSASGTSTTHGQTTRSFVCSSVEDDANKVDDLNNVRNGYEHTETSPEVDVIRESGNVQLEVSNIKRNKRAKIQGYRPSMSGPAGKQQPSKVSIAVPSKKPQVKLQKRKKKQATTSAKLQSPRKKSPREPSQLRKGTENRFIPQQSRPTLRDLQSKTPRWRFGCRPATTSAQSTLFHRTIETPERLEDTSLQQNKLRTGKSEQSLDKQRGETHYPFNEGTLSHSDLQRNNAHDKKDSLLLTGSPNQLTPLFTTPITEVKAGDNGRMTNHATSRIDETYPTADDRVTQDRIQNDRIDHSEGDQFLMAGKANTNVEEQQSDSESLPAYPRPVTRVDVIETQALSKTNKTVSNVTADPTGTHQVKTSNPDNTVSNIATHLKPSEIRMTSKTVTGVNTDLVEPPPQRMSMTIGYPVIDPKESHTVLTHNTLSLVTTDPIESSTITPVMSKTVGYGTADSQEFQWTNNTVSGMATDTLRNTKAVAKTDQGEDAVPTSFTVPVIIVDEASTVGDASEYSDDIDAVAIDADEYLAFSQYTQSEKQKEVNSLAPSHKHKNIRDLHQFNDHQRSLKSMLKVPPNPEVSGERMPSGLNAKSLHILRPGLEHDPKYSTSIALELAGLRTTLTPSTYNVEFSSQGPTSRRSNSPRQDTSTTSSHNNSRQTPSKPCSRKALSATTKHSSRSSISECSISGWSSSSESRVSMSKANALDNLTALFHLHPQEGPQLCSLKSAMSSRRSSMASVGTVHWDLALTGPSAPPSRQASWEGNRPHPAIQHSERRRHSTALGIHHEKFLKTSDLLNIQLNSSAENLSFHPYLAEGLKQGSAVSSRRQSMSTVNNDFEEGRLSTASAMSVGRSQRNRMDSVVQEDTDGKELARQASQYDPQVEKSERYNHQRENSFNKARQWLSPVCRGLRTLQVQYSNVNTTHNDSLIFADLLRAAHVKNAAVEEAVYSMERRLYTRRHGDTPHATTFFDTRHTLAAEARVRNAFRRSSSSGRSSSSSKKTFSTVAKKEKERQERIQKKNNELELGYTPRAESLKPLGPEDIEAIRSQCRHLRVPPHLQQHFYTLDTQLNEPTTEATDVMTA